MARVQWKKEKEEHPVEVIGRIRQNNHSSGIAIQLSDRGVRVKAESGHYRDFSLDGLSCSGEALNLFYVQYIKARVEGVKTGGKCTIILYGATGSGKSYTMFGTLKEPGIAYRALHHIMEEGEGNGGGHEIVKVRVVEIYNEEVYDLLGTGLTKGAASPGRVRLEVRGRKVKNACSISGKKADDIVREIQMVEKRRVVKSTNCNERSSRSHCIIIVDVPSVGGRLVLVDMAGSENIDQAATGMEAKMQTGKINQGNGALKRVVEAIANGDNYIPYRDSKLTMLLQDSFEDDQAKILMILCASTDPKDIYKTIGTLEYGAKAKCIVKLPKSPVKEKTNANDRVILETRINVMHALIEKLQADNRLKDECKEEIEKELNVKNMQVENLKSRVANMEREKLQFMVDMQKIDEKLLELIHRIENNKKVIAEAEIKSFTEMQEHQAKISEFIYIVQCMEDEVICKINKHQEWKGLLKESSMDQNSYCSMVKSFSFPNCLTIDTNGADISLTSRCEDETIGSCPVLQAQVDSVISEDPKNASNDSSQVLSFNVLKKTNDLSMCHSNDSCSVAKASGNQQTAERIRQKEEGTKRHSLRDWDEEVQFTVVCNDSEHQAVICRSCDQIDELSSLSDIDSEVPGPSIQVCSSADLHILKENNPNIAKDDDMKHSALPSKVFQIDDDDKKTDIHTCSETDTVTKPNPDKSCMFRNVSVNSTWVQSPGANGILGVDWTSGISFGGWLPAILEASFEGEEEGGTHDEGSREEDNKSQSGMENVEKVVIEMENIADRSKSEASGSNFLVDNVGTDPGNGVVGISFTGWLPDVPEASFEGEEDCETHNEGSKEDDNESHQGITKVEILVEMENMVDISRSEGSESNFMVDNPGTDLGNGAVHLQNEDDCYNPTLQSETGNSSQPDCSYIITEEKEADCKSQHLQTEANHNDRERGSQEAIQDSRQIDYGNCKHTETQNPCLNLGQEREQGEIQATQQNLEGIDEERQCVSSTQSTQEDQFSDDDSLHSFELGVNFDSTTDLDTVIKQRPSLSHEETEVIVLSDSPISSSASSEKADLSLSHRGKSYSSSLYDVCDVDVYVKWGKSTEELGKLICVVPIAKSASLAELRKEITPHIAHVNKQFTFLMLGESGGGEVDQKIERDLRVGSLPGCLAHKGSHLACLRPPRRIKLSLPPDRLSMPLSQIENQISNATQSVDKKKGSKSSTSQTGPSKKKGRLRNMLSRDNKSKMTFKDKARALYFQDITCSILHGV